MKIRLREELRVAKLNDTSSETETETECDGNGSNELEKKREENLT